MHPNDSAWQAFRVSLLSPLTTGRILHEDREAYFQKLAKDSHYAPDGNTTLSVRTLRRWYQTYRKQGIEGLKKKRRSDVTINKLLLVEFFSELPSSTMYRHLRIRGATKTQLGVVREKVRCRRMSIPIRN